MLFFPLIFVISYFPFREFWYFDQQKALYVKLLFVVVRLLYFVTQKEIILIKQYSSQLLFIMNYEKKL